MAVLRGARAVLARELAGALESPSSWVAMVGFVLAVHGLYFFVGFPVGQLQFPNFWDAGVAGLQTVWAWLPPLFAVLAPSLSMGVWAEERRSGTEELLLSWPLPSASAVLGKFGAVWVQLSLALLFAVVPLALVVDGLGDLDWGAVQGGLLGGVALGAACVALGQLVSALTRDQLVAFVIAGLLLGGLWAADFALSGTSPAAAAALALFSPSAHFLDGAALGLIDLADLGYFGLATAALLLCTWLAVEARRRR